MDAASQSPPSHHSWDKDTDEVLSEDSQVLYETRPNRWRGPATSWKALTENDIKIATSLDQEQNKDLGIHLYNDYALKRLKPEGWKPPSNWTAWPLLPKAVPRDDFIRHGDSDGLLGDEVYSYRRRELFKSSRQWLVEELTACVIKHAKERFREERFREERGREERGRPESEVAEDDDAGAGAGTRAGAEGTNDKDDEEMAKHTDVATSAVPSPSSSPSPPPRQVVDEEMDLDPQHPQIILSTPSPNPPPGGKSQADFAAIPCTDDAVSAHLVKPEVDHIIKQITNSLMVLQNAYVAATGVDATSQSESDTDSTTTSSRRVKSPFRSRSRSVSVSRTSVVGSTTGASDTDGSRPRSKRGRPKKHTQLEGETEREMMIRVARLQHKKIPVFSDDDDEGTEPAPRRGRPFKNATGKGKQVAAAAAAQSDDDMKDADDDDLSHADDSDADTNETSKTGTTDDGDEDEVEGPWTDVDSGDDGGKNTVYVERRGLRNWKDILGAASIAGVKTEAIRRAAQRCSTLFGEEYEMVTVHEGGRIERKTFGPNVSLTDSEEKEEEEEENQDIEHDVSTAHICRPSSASLHHHRRASSSSQSFPEEDTVLRIGTFTCPVPPCPRSHLSSSFRRKYNLLRHTLRAHGLNEAQTTQLLEDTGCKDDGGATHVDGFLRPVRIQRGWRTEDSIQRKLRGPRKPGDKHTQVGKEEGGYKRNRRAAAVRGRQRTRLMYGDGDCGGENGDEEDAEEEEKEMEGDDEGEE
ncbi:hypothetical protein MKZ38_010444 [Zalerion maritima]|uniref:Rrn9 domain-containing protein n=1 Tax=Zalerion maritima TaxID=339359 RepID=A0AAD5RTP8_9PEZI|nr:hypothetical protein MKZ38_010444 [Zalerion maritima]